MTYLRTISRAILALLLAAAFLAMSIAGGLHELTHLTRHAHSVARHLAGDAGGASLKASIEQGAPSQGSSTASEFCFFCTFGSSVTFAFATIGFEPAAVTVSTGTIPDAPDTTTRPSVLPSLRAPPIFA